MSGLPDVTVTWREVFGSAVGQPDEPFLTFQGLTKNVTFFVGRNGSGKSRAALRLAEKLGARLLSTDRLTGLMRFNNWGWGSAPDPERYQGLPLGAQERSTALDIARQARMPLEEIYALRDEPEVALRVAAFVRRALGRSVELREVSGFLDPHVRYGEADYSLLRDEGHGLRELVLLLAAIYRTDWSALIVDEPELHVHPAMARLWLAELQEECSRGGRTAFVITHEPSLLNPRTSSDLRSIWLFSPGGAPSLIGDSVLPEQDQRVSASLEENPALVSSLVFSPRPVLVEGKHDVAALSASLARTQPREAVAQTDLVDCGGTGGVALWFEIARKLDLDVRAVADLDGLFSPAIRRTMDRSPKVVDRYREELGLEPPTTSEALNAIQARMGQDGVDANPRAKAEWLAELSGDGHVARRDQLLGIWRDAGLWLHPQGCLEHVLGLSDKGISAARTAAQTPGDIDEVAEWAAYRLDPTGDIELLLGAAVERIAHRIAEAQRLDPDLALDSPVGPSADVDGLLVDVTALGGGAHRLTVKVPREFAGWWVNVSRDTRSSELVLKPPAEHA